MDYQLIVSKIYADADFNPACFNFTEQVARDKKLWRDSRPMPTQLQLDAAALITNAESAVVDLYNVMVSEIYDEMYNVFGTRNDASAMATASTYEAMAKRPGNYVGALGLVDEAAVTAYANTKIAEADTYAIFRMDKIVKFQADKQALINP